MRLKHYDWITVIGGFVFLVTASMAIHSATAEEYATCVPIWNVPLVSEMVFACGLIGAVFAWLSTRNYFNLRRILLVSGAILCLAVEGYNYLQLFWYLGCPNRG